MKPSGPPLEFLRGRRFIPNNRLNRRQDIISHLLLLGQRRQIVGQLADARGAQDHGRHTATLAKARAFSILACPASDVKLSRNHS